MRTLDVFVFESTSLMMMSGVVCIPNCKMEEKISLFSFAPLAQFNTPVPHTLSEDHRVMCKIGEMIELLSDTINGDEQCRDCHWCVLERLPDRGFGKNCAMAGERFESILAAKAFLA